MKHWNKGEEKRKEKRREKKKVAKRKDEKINFFYQSSLKLHLVFQHVVLLSHVSGILSSEDYMKLDNFNDNSSYKYCCAFCKPSFHLGGLWIRYTIFIKWKSCWQNSEETLFMHSAREGTESQLASCKILRKGNSGGDKSKTERLERKRAGSGWLNFTV